MTHSQHPGYIMHRLVCVAHIRECVHDGNGLDHASGGDSVVRPICVIGSLLPERALLNHEVVSWSKFVGRVKIYKRAEYAL